MAILESALVTERAARLGNDTILSKKAEDSVSTLVCVDLWNFPGLF